MPVYRRSNGLDDALSNAVVLGERADFFLIFLRQPERGEQVLLFVDVVGFNDCREDGEPILRVERSVEVVAIDTCHLLHHC